MTLTLKCSTALVGCIPMLMDCLASHGTSKERSSREEENEVAWIQSVNVEPLSKESIRTAQSQDPVLSQIVMWLKAGVRPPRNEAEGGGMHPSVILVTVGASSPPGWSSIQTLGTRTNRPRDLSATLFAGNSCAPSALRPS